MTVLRTALIGLLFVVAVAGWAVAGNLLLQTIPVTSAPDATLTQRAVDYATKAVAAEAGPDVTYQALEPLVASDGPAWTALKAIEAAKPDQIAGLKLVGSIGTTMLWRAGDTALVEVEYTVINAGAQTKIAEHYMLRLTDGNWLIWAIWRITPDPGLPLIPQFSSSPSATAAPSETPGPSETTSTLTPPPVQTGP